MAAERRRAIWSVLFLVLSQSFGGTLQCVTSSAHPKERIIVSSDYETTAPEQGVSQVQSHHYGPGSLEEDEIEKTLSSSELSGMENPIFLRVPRREEHGDHGRQHHSSKPISEQEATVQLCSHRLRQELVKICDGKFHEPISHVENSIGPTDAATRQARKRSMRKRGQEILRRVPRNLVDQCCKNQCRKQDMLKYCDRRTPTVDSLINSRRIEVIADPTDGTPSTELAEDPEPNSALYYPLFHIINMLHRQFTKSRPVDEGQSVPNPMARVQDDTSSSLHYHRPSDPNFRNVQQQQTSLRFPYALVDESARGAETVRGHTGTGPNHPPIYNPQQETNDLNMDNSAGSDYDDDGASVRVRGINAVTSTLPSRIISFGRGTYDT